MLFKIEKVAGKSQPQTHRNFYRHRIALYIYMKKKSYGHATS